MHPHHPFKLNRQATLLALIAAIYPMTGYSAVGRLDFVVGRVAAVGVDGRERVLVKGAEIDSGESVNTAVDGRAQIRFTDGAYVSLQPNTAFKVDEYRYSGKTDGSEKGFFSLLKGGLRTITGAIGHGKNQKAYQVATPAATIGIRGTGYQAQLGNSLTVSVGEGAVSLTNSGGELVLSAGQSGYVQDFNTAPQMTFEKPATPPAPVSQGATQTGTQQQAYTGGDTVNTSGEPTVIPPTPTTHTITGVIGLSSDPHNGLRGDVNSTIVYDSNYTNRISFTNSAGMKLDFSTATLDITTPAGSPTVASYDSTNSIGWGRWTGTLTQTEGGVSSTLTYGANQGFHGVAGVPTLATAMPTSGTLTFSLIGATRPTTDTGNYGLGTVLAPNGTYGKMDVTFSPGGYSINLGSLQFTMPGLGGQTFTLFFQGSALSGNTFTSPNVSAYTTASGGGYCSGSCSSSISGFFAGSNANRAGIAYVVNSGGIGTPLPDNIRGAAVFGR